MVQYQLRLELENWQKPYIYKIDLNVQQENDPEKLFQQEIRQSLSKDLEGTISCQISPNKLEKILSRWIEDIKEGYRETTMNLELPSTQKEQDLKFREENYEIDDDNIPELVMPDLSGIEPQVGCLPPLDFS